MATIQREILVQASPEHVWEALRDVGAIHQRLAQGFVTNTTLDGDIREVSFANGMVVRERIITVADDLRRLAYGVIDGPTHHSASFQVVPEGAGQSRVLWTTDLAPDELAPRFTTMIEQGLVAIKKTLETSARAQR
jgi:carbon monoxide dehydrogenase subunit G